MRRIPCILALAVLAPAAPALSAAPQDAQAISSMPEAGDPEAARRMLNAEQADRARQQAADNVARAQRYDAQLVGNELEAEHNASVYERTLQQHDLAVDNYRADRKQWEVRNPACWKGNAVKCPAEPPVPAGGS